MGLWRNLYNKVIFAFRLFPGKINDKVLQKMKNTPFLARFANFWEKQNFLQNSVLTNFFILILTKSGSQATLVSDGQTRGRISMIL